MAALAQLFRNPLGPLSAHKRLPQRQFLRQLAPQCGSRSRSEHDIHFFERPLPRIVAGSKRRSSGVAISEQHSPCPTLELAD